MQAVSLPQVQKVQITLVNGATLKSRRKYDRGGKFWQTYQITNPAHKKEQMPIVSGKSSGTNFHLAVLDFDYIAPGFTSYSEIAALFDIPGCVVTASPSGKLKVFVSIKWKNAYPDTNEVLEVLKDAIIPPKLWTSVDKAGLWNFFLSDSIATALSNVAHLPYADLTHSNIDSDRNKPLKVQSFTYRIADICTPAMYDSFINRGRKGAAERESFVRLLIASYGLCSKHGWQLSQPCIAEQLNVAKGSVNAWFKMFVDKGWLRKASNRYVPGVDAICYYAGAELLDQVRDYKINNPHNVRKITHKLPVAGEYHIYFLRLSKKLPNWADYKEALEATPGMNRKRWKHAKGVFKCDRNKELKRMRNL